MITRDIPKKQRNAARKRRAAPNQQNKEGTLRGLLWRIIMNQGGNITVPYSDLQNIPENAGLHVDNIPGTDKVEIKAVINSPIETQVKRIIT